MLPRHRAISLVIPIALDSEKDRLPFVPQKVHEGTPIAVIKSRGSVAAGLGSQGAFTCGPLCVMLRCDVRCRTMLEYVILCAMYSRFGMHASAGEFSARGVEYPTGNAQAILFVSFSVLWSWLYHHSLKFHPKPFNFAFAHIHAGWHMFGEAMARRRPRDFLTFAHLPIESFISRSEVFRVPLALERYLDVT